MLGDWSHPIPGEGMGMGPSCLVSPVFHRSSLWLTTPTCCVWVWVIPGFIPEKWPASISGAESHILNFYFFHPLIICHHPFIYTASSKKEKSIEIAHCHCLLSFLLEVNPMIILWWCFVWRGNTHVCSNWHLSLAVS